MHFRQHALIVTLIAISPWALHAEDQSRGRRLTPAEISKLTQPGAGAGSSGVAGIHTVVLAGDPTKPGLYTIGLSVPPNTRIQAHTHRDERSAVVVSGTWRIGYGAHFDEHALKVLPQGSFYTEPAGEAHFAQTTTDAVLVYITGSGPTDTVYVDASQTPPKPAH